MGTRKFKKTNAMRELDSLKVSYDYQCYEVDESDLSGLHVAELLKQDPRCVFKTLVLTDPQGDLCVCIIPVAKELDLKKAAHAALRKSLSMLPLKDLQSKTGYIRGACSPIAMKKSFPTFFDKSCLACTHIAVSAGQRGIQIIADPRDLIKVTQADVVDLVLR